MHLSKAFEIVVGLTVSLFMCMSYSHVLTHDGIRSVSEPKPGSFIDNVFDKYGTNNSITLQEFKELLKNLYSGVTTDARARKSDSSEQSGTWNGSESKSKCYPAKTLFEAYSIGSDGLDKKEFAEICPAIVQQIDSGACVEEDDSEEEELRQSKAKAWGFGFLSVTIISCASLLGAFVVPFMNQSFYRVLLLFMVSLAVGVLSGSGIFHLVPHAFRLGHLPDGSHDYSYLWKCLTIVGGLYLFFFLEYIMKMIVRFKEKTIATEEHELENNPGKNEIPGAAIADVQLQLYSTTKDHPHVHGKMFFMNPKLSDKSNDSHTIVYKPCQENGATKNKVAKNPEEKRRVAPVAWMILIGDGLHNFIDGLAIGTSFSSSTYVGISTALAIFCEELPHELGDFAVLLNAGMNYRRAMAFNFLSACLCYLGLVIGLLLGYITSAVSWIYALAGGMFIYISLVNMLEEATEMSVKLGAESIYKNLKTFALQNFGIVIGFTVMFILAQYGSYITVE